MSIEPVHLIGAGGHGRVVVDALIAGGVDLAAITVRDSRPGLAVFGRQVATPEIASSMAGGLFHVAVGAGPVRARLHAAALAIGARPLGVIHPAATVAPGIGFGKAAMVAAGAVIAPDASIGDGTIVNHGAIVDHDCRIGAFCHVAPNATLGGGVETGDRVMIGAGAVVLPGLSIADDVTIGAGAVVIWPINKPGTWVGNPARRLAT